MMATDLRIDVIARLERYIADHEKAAVIELSIYNRTIKLGRDRGIWLNWSNVGFLRIYQDIAFDICSNLDPESDVANDWLREKIGSTNIEELNEWNIGAREYYELFPARWEEIVTRVGNAERKRMEVAHITNGLFKCSRCGGRNTRFQMVQLRSCDESMTVLCECNDCGNTWKK